jgi:hypothetical protein
MMVVIGVIAVLLGGGIWGVDMNRRASAYRQTAAALGRREREARKEQQERLQLAASLDRQAEDQVRMPQFRESAKNAASVAEYHRRLADRRRHEADHYARLRGKYERAAARPWLPVGPDPPEPCHQARNAPDP